MPCSWSRVITPLPCARSRSEQGWRWAGSTTISLARNRSLKPCCSRNTPTGRCCRSCWQPPGESLEAFAQNAARTMMAIELGKRPDFLKLAFIELSEFKGNTSPSCSRSSIPEIFPLLQRFQGAGERAARPAPARHLALLPGDILRLFYGNEPRRPHRRASSWTARAWSSLSISSCMALSDPNQDQPVLPNHPTEDPGAERL